MGISNIKDLAEEALFDLKVSSVEVVGAATFLEKGTSLARTLLSLRVRTSKGPFYYQVVGNSSVPLSDREEFVKRVTSNFSSLRVKVVESGRSKREDPGINTLTYGERNGLKDRVAGFVKRLGKEELSGFISKATPAKDLDLSKEPLSKVLAQWGYTGGIFPNQYD